MNKKTILETIKLNKNFYIKHQEDFSKTRQNPWPGWEKALDLASTNLVPFEIDVLDIGCGNARFYEYLKAFSHKKVSYLGIDNNDYFLVEALLKHKEAEFKNLDVLLELDQIEQTYDLVVAFGITHHIPGNDFRLKWFEEVASKVKTGGMLVHTFWQLDQDDRFHKAEKANNLEANDYYYGWDKSDDKRYVHIYDDTEQQNILNLHKKLGLYLISEFENDGKTGKLNKYWVFKRE